MERLEIVPHQIVWYRNQECIVRDLDDSDESALLEKENGEQVWVGYDTIASYNPDLVVEEEEDELLEEEDIDLDEEEWPDVEDIWPEY